MRFFRLFTLAVLLGVCGPLAASDAPKHTFEIKNGSFLHDGKPVLIHSGELHYARVPAPYWRHRLRMMKAMGLNAVTTYVFWNYHEVSPGQWDWSTGNRNLRRFVREAGQEGMMVILRPGPYCCAEWEYGGYPWWLQNVKGLVIRAYNQQFLDSCKQYVGQLMGQVRDLQITRGGPIVMVQAENEFGSYVAQRPDIPLEEHKKYSHAIRQMLIDEGVDVPLFTSDGSWLFKGGSIEGALPTANGEDNVDKIKQVVNEFHGGQGPYFVAEFYPGWFTHWAEPYGKVSVSTVLKQTKKYLDGGVSFNYYMVHGGTNHGFWSGANYSNATNIQPDVTSYDYDAPISEAGWTTEKYDSLRALLGRYAGKKLPDVPARIPVITVPEIPLKTTKNLFAGIEKMPCIESDSLMSFEDLGQGQGYVLYRRHFTQPIGGVMRVPGLADYATVYVNGSRVGVLNRVTGADSLELNVPFNATLDILVENLGRINYGARITQNRKGLTAPITIDDNEITGNWRMYKLPMSDENQLLSLPDGYTEGCPTAYTSTFEMAKVGDTFVNMEGWGKGIVFVNGVNLGRYWRVGPQQTLYLPGCFLVKGTNRITIFEQLNDQRKASISTVSEPVLDKLNLEP